MRAVNLASFRIPNLLSRRSISTIPRPI